MREADAIVSARVLPLQTYWMKSAAGFFLPGFADEALPFPQAGRGWAELAEKACREFWVGRLSKRQL